MAEEYMDNTADTKAEVQMVETNMGKMPLDDYLEIRAQQCGFDSYEELREAGLSISIDKNREKEEYAVINDVDERLSRMGEEERDAFIQETEMRLDYNEGITAEDRELYEKILEERAAGIQNTIEAAPEKKNDAGMEMANSFSEIAAKIRDDIIRRNTEAGTWQARIANKSRPQDYLQIGIEGNPGTHEVTFRADIIHANEYEDSRSFTVKTGTGSPEERADKLYEDACREFESNSKDILEKLDTDMESTFTTYSPFTEQTLDRHYDRLNGLGYESEPSYGLHNLNKDGGFTISTDKNSEKEQKKEAADIHKRKCLQGRPR